MKTWSGAFVIVVALAHVAQAIQVKYDGPKTGKATQYGTSDQGGACLFPPRQDGLFAAFPGVSWNHASYCGACIQVTGSTGSAIVQITNELPEGAAGDLDLSASTLPKVIGSTGKGAVTWDWVDCKAAGLVKGDLEVVWKTGSSAYWSAIQVRNYGVPVQGLSAQRSGSNMWETLERQDYNYFLAPSGLGPGPVNLHITFQDGSSQDVSSVQLNSKVGDS